MTKSMSGVITIVQEGRFQMTDDFGTSHLFLLGGLAAAEAEQLSPLVGQQARVRVDYAPAANLIGYVAHAIYLFD